MRHGFNDPDMEPNGNVLTATQGPSISQHLRETKEVLQCVVFNPECVRSVNIGRIGGLIFEFAGSQRP